jgi:hypothetical protein
MDIKHRLANLCSSSPGVHFIAVNFSCIALACSSLFPPTAFNTAWLMRPVPTHSVSKLLAALPILLEQLCDSAHRVFCSANSGYRIDRYAPAEPQLPFSAAMARLLALSVVCFCAKAAANKILIFEDTFDKFDLRAWKHDLTLGGGG